MSSRFRSLAPAVVAVTLTSALAVSSSGLLSAARKGASGPRGADQVDVGRLRADLSFIASDELEGRDTPSRGLDLAARYLASRLQALGLKPGGDDGGYFQRFGTTRRTVDPAKATVTLGERTFSYGDDFLASAPGTAEGADGLRRPRLRREEEERRRLRRRRREGEDRRRPLRVSGRRHPRRSARRVRARHVGEPGELCGPPRRPRRRARARLRDPGRLAHQPRERASRRAGR